MLEWELSLLDLVHPKEWRRQDWKWALNWALRLWGISSVYIMSSVFRLERKTVSHTSSSGKVWASRAFSPP